MYNKILVPLDGLNFRMRVFSILRILDVDSASIRLAAA